MPSRTIQFTTTKTKAYEDTSFVTGDSPRVLEVRDDLSNKPANAGYFINDGNGDIIVQIYNNDQNDYGDQHTIKAGEMVQLNGLNIRRIKLTWVTNSAYRILVG